MDKLAKCIKESVAMTNQDIGKALDKYNDKFVFL